MGLYHRRLVLIAIVMVMLGTAAAAEPADCGGFPISLRGIEAAACSIETRFDFNAFYVNVHDKRFSVPPAVIPGVDARGEIHELRGRGPRGETLYGALARSHRSTHIRFMNDLERWAAVGWLPWRRGGDSDWSATGTVTSDAGKWYFARFSWRGQRCLVIQRYQALHENGYRYAVIAATCRIGATYGETEAARLADAVIITGEIN